MAVTRGLGPHPVVRGFPGKVCCSPVHLAHFFSSAAPRYICTYLARMPAPVRCFCTLASSFATQDLKCGCVVLRCRSTASRLQLLSTRREACPSSQASHRSCAASWQRARAASGATGRSGSASACTSRMPLWTAVACGSGKREAGGCAAAPPATLRVQPSPPDLRRAWAQPYGCVRRVSSVWLLRTAIPPANTSGSLPMYLSHDILNQFFSRSIGTRGGCRSGSYKLHGLLLGCRSSPMA